MTYSKAEADRDEAELLRMAAEAEGRGAFLTACLYRVEAGNCQARVGMKFTEPVPIGKVRMMDP